MHKNRLLLAALVVVMLVIPVVITSSYPGIHNTRGNGLYDIQVSGSLAVFISSLLLLVIVLFFKRSVHEYSHEKVGVFSRFGAFVVDYIVIIFMVTPLVSFPLLITEYIHTGVFVWGFHREYEINSDNYIVSPVNILFFTSYILYYYLHLRRSISTVGQYIFGYVVVIKDKAEVSKFSALRHIILSLIALIVWPITVVLEMVSDSNYMWHERFSSYAAQATGCTGKEGSRAHPEVVGDIHVNLDSPRC